MSVELHTIQEFNLFTLFFFFLTYFSPIASYKVLLEAFQQEWHEMDKEPLDIDKNLNASSTTCML
jgi:hypothetical protein